EPGRGRPAPWPRKGACYGGRCALTTSGRARRRPWDRHRPRRRGRVGSGASLLPAGRRYNGGMLALTLAALLTPQDLPPAPPPPPAADPARLERTVRDLVGFGTRHVLSSTAAPDRGTGAARAYLERCFEACIPASGGRLKVRRARYTVAARRRRMDRLEAANVVAELPGTTDPERVYVVSGHYDSRNRDGGDGERDAPGANDDGSGTALVVEVCRLLCE